MTWPILMNGRKNMQPPAITMTGTSSRDSRTGRREEGDSVSFAARRMAARGSSTRRVHAAVPEIFKREIRDRVVGSG
jgi:hypothetical protein